MRPVLEDFPRTIGTAELVDDAAAEGAKLDDDSVLGLVPGVTDAKLLILLEVLILLVLLVAVAVLLVLLLVGNDTLDVAVTEVEVIVAINVEMGLTPGEFKSAVLTDVMTFTRMLLFG